jgi:hypothetical protein
MEPGVAEVVSATLSAAGSDVCAGALATGATGDTGALTVG